MSKDLHVKIVLDLQEAFNQLQEFDKDFFRRAKNLKLAPKIDIEGIESYKKHLREIADIFKDIPAKFKLPSIPRGGTGTDTGTQRPSGQKKIDNTELKKANALLQESSALTTRYGRDLDALNKQHGIGSQQANAFAASTLKTNNVFKLQNQAITALIQSEKQGVITSEQLRAKLAQIGNQQQLFKNKMEMATPIRNIQGLVNSISMINPTLGSVIQRVQTMGQAFNSLKMPPGSMSMPNFGMASDWQAMEGASSGVLSNMTKLVPVIGSAVAVVGSLTAGFKIASDAINTGKKFEDMEYQMTALINSSTRFKEEGTKNFVGMQKNLELSLNQSKQLIAKFVQDAPMLAGTNLEELTQTASVTLGRLASAGINDPKEQAALIESMTVAIKTVTAGQQNQGVQLAQESRALLAGEFKATNTLINTLAVNVGGKEKFKALYEEAKRAGKLGEFLTQQLNPFLEAANYASNSMANLGEIWQDVMTNFNRSIANSGGMFESFKNLTRGFLSNFVDLKELDPADVINKINKAFEEGNPKAEKFKKELTDIRESLKKGESLGVQDLATLKSAEIGVELNFGKILPQIEELSKKLGEAFSGTFKALQPLTKPIGDFFLKLGEIISGTISVLNPFISIFSSILAPALSLSNSLLGMLGGSLNMLAPMFNLLASSISAISMKIQEFTNFIGQNQAFINTAKIAMGGLASYFLLLGASRIPLAIAAIGKWIGALRAMIPIQTLAMTLNPFGWVQVAVVAIGALSTALYMFNKDFANFVNSFVSGTIGMATNIPAAWEFMFQKISLVADQMKLAWLKLWNSFPSPVKQALNLVGNGIKMFINVVFFPAITAFKAFLDITAKALRALGKEELASKFEGALKGIKDLTKVNFSNLMGDSKDVDTKGLESSINARKAVLSTAWKGFQTTGKNTLDNIGKGFTAVPLNQAGGEDDSKDSKGTKDKASREAERRAIDEEKNRQAVIEEEYKNKILDIEKNSLKIANEKIDKQIELNSLAVEHQKALYAIEDQEMALSLEEKKIQLAVKRGELSEREGIIAKSQLDARNIELEYQKVQIDLAKKQEEIDLAKIENEKQITAEKNKQIELQLNLEKTSKEIASKEQLLSSGKLDTQSYNQVSNEIIKLNSEREKILVDIEKQKNNILNIEKETTSEIIKRQGLLEEEGKQAKDVYVNKQQQRDIQKAIDLTPQIRNMGDMFRDASKGLASSIIGAFRDGGDNAKDKILDALTNFSTKIQDKMIDNMLNKLFSGGGTSGSGGFNVGSIFSNFGSTSGGTNQASSNNFDFSRAADGYWTAIEKTTGSITELDTKCLQVAKSMVGTGDGFGSAVSSMVNGMGSFFSNLFSGGKGGESGGGFKMPSFGSKGKMAMPQMKEMATMAVTMGSGMIAGFMGTGESQIGSAISGIGGAVGSGLMMTGNPIAMGAGAIISIGSALIGGIFGSRAKKKKKAIAKAKEDIKNSINALNITLENISLELEKVIIGFSDIIDGANREISKLDLSKSIWTIQKAINKTLGGSIRKVDEELVSSLEKQRADLASKFSKEADEKLRIELEKAKKGVITPTGILDALEAQRDALAEATQKQLDAVGGTIDYFNSKTGAKYGGSMYGEAIPELKKKIDEIKANFEKSDKEIKKNIADYQDKIQEWMKAQRDLLFNFNREVDREFTVETFGSAGGDIYDQIMAFNDKVVDLLGSGFDPDKVTYIIQRQAIQLQNNLKEKVKQLHNDFAERLIGLQDELFDVLTEGRATGQIQKTQQDKLQDIRRRIDELYAEQQATANSELAGFGTNLSDANKALEYFTNQINENYLEALQNAKSGLTAQEQIQINVYDPAEIARIVEEKLRNNSSLPSFLRQAAV